MKKLRFLSLAVLILLSMALPVSAAQLTEPILLASGYDGSIGKLILISFAIGAAVALVVLLIMRGQMNTVRSQRAASNYLCRDTYHLTSRQDVYLYSTTTRVRKTTDKKR